MSCDNLFHLGVCLGHQIIGRVQGDKVIRSQMPLHGQAVPLKIPSWEGFFPKKTWNRNIQVQRYNSLTVRRRKVLGSLSEVLDENGEVLIRSFKQGISYQFHPESVGTSFPSLFFEPLKYFLYNFRYEKPDSARWNL